MRIESLDWYHDACMLTLIQKNKLWFLSFLLLGLALRLFAVFQYSQVNGDTFVYGEMAKNLLHSHVMGVRIDGQPVPSYVRLPGYPAFLAVIFAIVGDDHYNAVMFTQVAIDLLTCFLVAAAALEIGGERAAKIAFLLAALCPFTSSFCAAPLTEVPAIFCVAGALWSAIKMLKADGISFFCLSWTPRHAATATTRKILDVRLDHRRNWSIACGLWNAAGILLRPDAPVLLASICLYTLVNLWRSKNFAEAARTSILTGLIAIAPLVPWTLRNWHQFHRFQPLAPRYANMPGEFVPMGFNRWTKTWCAELTSVYDIYWKIEDEDIHVEDLPNRAFDSPAQRDLTAELFAEYNATDDHEISPALDARFAALAQERIDHSRLRYYVWLPTMRVADMWFRPRTETLPIENRWWEFDKHEGETYFAVAWMLLNLFYVGTAVVTLLCRLRIPFSGMLALFILLRSLMLATIENPEPRYTLECFPAVILLSSAGLARFRLPNPGKSATTARAVGRSS